MNENKTAIVRQSTPSLKTDFCVRACLRASILCGGQKMALDPLEAGVRRGYECWPISPAL